MCASCDDTNVYATFPIHVQAEAASAMGLWGHHMLITMFSLLDADWRPRFLVHGESDRHPTSHLPHCNLGAVNCSDLVMHQYLQGRVHYKASQLHAVAARNAKLLPKPG